MFEEQQRIVNTQQATLVRIERVLMDVVTGRVWRTLRAAGNVIKKIMPGVGTNPYGESQLRACQKHLLVCDEPLALSAVPDAAKSPYAGGR